ncbi:MAG: hypothetical protein P4L31_02735 [Candidatus Babeliales bacterium]|nr:hypothetical protein [Candidatus Babeliales bacterium]
MKCQKLKSTTIRNSFFAVCILLGSTLATQCGAAKTDFDKILNKKDLDTIILEIKKELNRLQPNHVDHFNRVSGVMFEARNDFFDPNNNDHISVHAEKMKINYALWHNEIVKNEAYDRSIREQANKLYAKLAAMLLILQKFTDSGNSFLEIGNLGIQLRPYEHLLPKHLNKNLISLLRKRLKQC